ncbi:MAG: 4Fe-4S dicluster domain-containing protein, partial [Halanaerobiales bacterium]
MSKLNFNFLNKKVINEGLCSMCGTCVGVCPQNVIGYKNNIEYTPVWLNVNGCINCGFCVDSCPGRGYKIEGLNKTHTNRVGKYKDILRGFSTDKFIYENSSSGGISTATLKYLLDKNIANEVIVVKNSDSI